MVDNEFRGRQVRSRRRWPIAAMAGGVAITLVAGVKMAKIDAFLDRGNNTAGQDQITLGIMDRFGQMESRKVLWRGHVEQGLGTGNEHHATLTVAKQRNSATEPDRFLLSFTDAFGMEDPFDSRNISHASVQIGETGSNIPPKIYQLHKTSFWDKETGKIKSSWETSVNLPNVQNLQMRVISIDAVLREVRAFDYKSVTLPTL